MSTFVGPDRSAGRLGAHTSSYRGVMARIVVSIGLGVAVLAVAAPANAVSPSAAGSWTIVASPNTSPSQSDSDYLAGVSCSSPANCVAVGNYYTPEPYPVVRTPLQTLIESWNGSVWNIVPSPDSGSGDNQLNGVSCSSPTRCIAVGTYFASGSGDRTLIESWNGTVWSLVPSPNPSSGDIQLNGVSCSRPSRCTAVGTYYANGDRTLIESWNGSLWSIVPSPNYTTSSPSLQGNGLGGVSCIRPSSCISVGAYYPNSPYISQTLIESWNGTVWSLVPSPNTSTTQGNELGGVSCVSRAACVAAGFYSGTQDQTLVESWNGSVWSIVPSPDSSPTQNNELFGVSCSALASCVAVGRYRATNEFQALIESWNGSAWSIAPSPSLGGSSLDGISCTAVLCNAAGGYSNPSRTLIESGVGPQLAITTESLPNGSLWNKNNRVTYSATLAADGGNPPYKWSLASGSSPLPPDLKLSAKGVISGRVTTAGTYQFTVQVVDKKTRGNQPAPSTQNSATQTLSIRIS